MTRLVALIALLLVVGLPVVALAQDETPLEGTAREAKEAAEPATPESSGSSLAPEHRANVAAFVACSVAFITAISVLGAAYAVAHVGSAAIGAASEKPEMMGRSLIFVALGEGLAVLGLAVAFVMMFMVLTELIK